MAKFRVSQEARLGADLAGADMDLIEQLVAFRKIQGLSQEKVAERMGVKRTTVSRLESLTGPHSKNHTMLTVRKYAEAVGAYIGHLVVGGIGAPGDPAPYAALRETVQANLFSLKSPAASHVAPESLPSHQAFGDAAKLSHIEGGQAQWKNHPPSRSNNFRWANATVEKVQ